MAVSSQTLDLVAERANEGRKARRISDDVVEALRDDGFFRHFTPATYGGARIPRRRSFSIKSPLPNAT